MCETHAKCVRVESSVNQLVCLRCRVGVSRDTVNNTKYSRTSLSAHSEKQTHSLERTKF